MKITKKDLLALAVSLAVTLLIGAGSLRRVDKWAQDSLFQHPGVTSGDIVIIGIDDEALDLLGPYNTWDRNIIASALEALAADPEKKPAVTAIDILYAGQSFQQPDDRLVNAARSLGNVVTASLANFGEEIIWENGRAISVNTSSILGYTEPFEKLRECTTQGHINAMTDRDGVMRHAILYVEPGGNRVYSMAAETARIFLEKHEKSLRLPSTGPIGQFYVPFTGLPGNYYDGVSLAWLLSGKVPADYWADKIVLIGPYAAAFQDAYFTSIDKGTQMYGVEFQDNVIQSLIEKKKKKEVSDLFQLCLLFVLSGAAMILFLRNGVKIGGAICAGFVLFGLGSSFLLYKLGFVTHPLWIAVATIVLYMTAIIIHYIQTAKERQALALEKERIRTELDLAKRIQANSLPKVFPPFPDRHEFDLYASMTPAKEVGGDFYDFFLIDDDHLCLLIADVSGKGIPAALFMMLSSALIHNAALGEFSPAKVLQTANNQICANNPEEMFVTCWLGILEISTGKLTASNAGHEYPMIKKPDGRFELLKDKHGFGLGGMEGARYREYEIQMEPGSKVFVYTDGAAEATNSNDELFGAERLVTALQKGEEKAPGEILETVREEIEKFVGNAPQFDDLTMLCLQYTGS